ncbi:hypothetical protein LEP1GSC171_2973 [Leptospira santarosai str. HAI1380]|nr:hypothetical protein LEP1GSC175_1633 [Leptospira santarosai str. HAI821]EMP02133.1 hypothetical protein LEP1GSC171_2973 [Leptospira santarosai str. HAI1380]
MNFLIPARIFYRTVINGFFCIPLIAYFICFAPASFSFSEVNLGFCSFIRVVFPFWFFLCSFRVCSKTVSNPKIGS